MPNINVMKLKMRCCWAKHCVVSAKMALIIDPRIVAGSECDVAGQAAVTSAGFPAGCSSRSIGAVQEVRASVREVHRVTFAEHRNKYLNAEDPLCDGHDFELGFGLDNDNHRASDDDDDVEQYPRYSIIKLPRPPR